MGKIGEGSSRNMYKGHMDKAKGGRSRVGGGMEGSGREKMETMVLEKQLKKKEIPINLQ